MRLKSWIECSLQHWLGILLISAFPWMGIQHCRKDSPAALNQDARNLQNLADGLQVGNPTVSDRGRVDHWGSCGYHCCDVVRVGRCLSFLNIFEVRHHYFRWRPDWCLHGASLPLLVQDHSPQQKWSKLSAEAAIVCSERCTRFCQFPGFSIHPIVDQKIYEHEPFLPSYTNLYHFIELLSGS